jgi:hypothetical protein
MGLTEQLHCTVHLRAECDAKGNARRRTKFFFNCHFSAAVLLARPLAETCPVSGAWHPLPVESVDPFNAVWTGAV